MKKIFIAVDYNPSAQKVAEAGKALAEAMNATLALVHIITDPQYYAIEYSPIMGYQGFYSQNSNMMFEEIKSAAKDFLAASATHLGRNDIEVHVLEGDVAEAILDFGKSWNADLIVMGSHRHTGLQQLFTEDVAVNVLKHCNIPLLLVPTNEK